MSLGQTFASPRSHTHPIPTSTCALRYTCIRRWTLLGQQLDPAWINCESRHSVLLFGLSGLVSCTRFEPLRLRLGLDPSYHAARRTGSTSVRADRPISPPFTLQAQYFVHRFNRAHLFVFSSLSITSTSFLQTRLLSPARKFSRLDNITRPWQVSTSPVCLERPVYSPTADPSTVQIPAHIICALRRSQAQSPDCCGTPVANSYPQTRQRGRAPLHHHQLSRLSTPPSPFQVQPHIELALVAIVHSSLSRWLPPATRTTLFSPLSSRVCSSLR